MSKQKEETQQQNTPPTPKPPPDPPPPPQTGALSVFRKPTRAASLDIPENWITDPNCGEYITTMDEDDPVQSKIVARAMAGKTKSGKGSVNLPLPIIGITAEPFQSSPNEQGEQFAKIGFHLHLENGKTVFAAHFHVRKDIIALIRRHGMPSPKNVVHAVIEDHPTAKTYRLIAADLAD